MPKATADAITTRAPMVVIVLGRTPARMSHSVTGRVVAL
jgi:hypothetical protein